MAICYEILAIRRQIRVFAAGGDPALRTMITYPGHVSITYPLHIKFCLKSAYLQKSPKIGFFLIQSHGDLYIWITYFMPSMECISVICLIESLDLVVESGLLL